VTLCGLAGFSPYTYRSASSLISARRQRQSDFAAMRLPSSLRNGSGRRELAGNEPGTETAQSAPSSSTGAAAAAIVVRLTIVNAAATAREATVTTTSSRRILDRSQLMITR